MFKFYLLAALTLSSLALSSCSNNQSEEAEKDKKEGTNISELYQEERPDYDPSNIDPNAEVVTININATGTSMTDMSYDPAKITVKAGTTITLNLTNTSTDSSMPHNWVLVYDGTMEYVATAGIEAGLDNDFIPVSNDILTHTKLLGPQESTQITFKAPPAGTYQYVCTYPGHWSLMNGTLVVE